MDNKNTFPLGFWNYARLDGIGPDPVRDWAEAGMNLCHSPRFVPGEDDPAAMTALLDRCADNGIRLILDDPRCRWTGALSDPDGYRLRFRQMLDEFGLHPAVYGYYVGDEPGAAQMEEARAAVRLQRETAPDKVPFINFNPFYAHAGSVREHLGCADFDEWADGFVRDSGLQQLSYDHYLQMNPPDPAESGIGEYYTSLRRFMAAAKRNHIPLWVTNLSVGHFRYRCPKEDDLRWQLNTSVASGAKCVWWFFFYMRVVRINYRLAPIDEHGHRTETYEWLSRVQNTFRKQFGPLFAELIHDETFHTGRAYGGYPLLEEGRHPLLSRVSCDHGLPGVISLFHLPDGTKYAALVNNSQTESGYFHVWYTPKVKEMFRVCFDMQDTEKLPDGTPVSPYPYTRTAWGGVEVNCARNDVCNGFRIGPDGIVHNAAWLAPGQMEVWRLETED